MNKKILQKGDNFLLIPTTPITDLNTATELYRDLSDTINHLLTVHDFKRGIGLAAPQIGVSMSMSVVRYSGREYVLINPEVVACSAKKELIREGCISFFKYRGDVLRFPYVKIKAQGLDGEVYELEAYDDFAMLLQHEIDHLNGILYTTYLVNGESDLYLA